MRNVTICSECCDGCKCKKNSECACDTYSCLDKEHGDKLVGGRIGVLKRWTRKNE